MADGLFDLEGKVAVVSGAASGMGRASAMALAAHGATVVMLDATLANIILTNSRTDTRSTCGRVGTTKLSLPGIANNVALNATTIYP